MNARDKTYTGKVSEWGLPCGTVVVCTEILSPLNKWVIEKGKARQNKLNSLSESLTCKYKIVSLPTGYKFNDAGEIVKEETKRYWDGKEPLEVGMTVLYQGAETKIELPSDSNITYIVENKRGEWAFAGVIDLKPVDTRTKKEKAIDDVMGELACTGGTRVMVRDILSYTYDKWFM